MFEAAVRDAVAAALVDRARSDDLPDDQWSRPAETVFASLDSDELDRARRAAVRCLTEQADGIAWAGEVLDDLEVLAEA